MSSIKAFECLTGHISGLCTLSGELSCKGGLSGKLSAVINYNVYSGEYEVVPSAFNTQPEVGAPTKALSTTRRLTLCRNIDVGVV